MSDTQTGAGDVYPTPDRSETAQCAHAVPAWHQTSSDVEVEMFQGQAMAYVPPGTPGAQGVGVGLDPMGNPAKGAVVIVTVLASGRLIAQRQASRIARFVSACLWLCVAGRDSEAHVRAFGLASAFLRPGDNHPTLARALDQVGRQVWLPLHSQALDVMDRLVEMGLAPGSPYR